MRFSTYEKMIYERADSFANTTGINRDDFISLGHTVWVETLKKFNRKKGSFSTLFYIRLNYAFIYYARKFQPPSDNAVDFEEHLMNSHSEWVPGVMLQFKEKVLNLSEEAQHVIHLLLESPVEALGIEGTEPPKIIRGKIRDALRDEGWKWKTIWTVFRELKKAFP